MKGQPASMKVTELFEVDDTVEALLQKEPKGFFAVYFNSPFDNCYKVDYSSSSGR